MVLSSFKVAFCSSTLFLPVIWNMPGICTVHNPHSFCEVKQMHIWVTSNFDYNPHIMPFMLSPSVIWFSGKWANYPDCFSVFRQQSVLARFIKLVHYSQHNIDRLGEALTHVKSISVNISIGCNWGAGFIHIDVWRIIKQFPSPFFGSHLKKKGREKLHRWPWYLFQFPQPPCALNYILTSHDKIKHNNERRVDKRFLS